MALVNKRRVDEWSGLYYYRARCFSAQLGRFISRDPIEYRSGGNLVEYAVGSPANHVDVLGLYGVPGRRPIAAPPKEATAPPRKHGDICCCCVNDVTISQGTRYDETDPDTHRRLMGHEFTVDIQMYNHPFAGGSGDKKCTLEWREWADPPYYPGAPAQTWIDMYGLFLFEQEHGILQITNFFAWVYRPNPCPGHVHVAIPDAPGIEVVPNDYRDRLLRFEIVVKSNEGCMCAHREKRVRAVQRLEVDGGEPDWGESFFLPY